MPGTGIELGERAPRLLARDAAAVAGALQGAVVQEEGHAVGAELGVALEHAVAVLGAQAEGGHCVLGRQLACAAVGDPERVWPRLHWVTSALRAAVFAFGAAVRLTGVP